MNPYTISREDLLKELSVSPERGLSTQEAQERLAKYGENKLTEKKKKTNLQRFLDQFKDAMIIILLVAAAVSFGVACFGHDPMEFFEPALILLIVVLNAVLGMMQESKAEKALDALKNLSAPHARVLRDGKEQVIDASQLVPGDIIRLEAGDFIPADVRLLKSVSLKSEEAALTGESVPAEKDAGQEIPENAPLGQYGVFRVQHHLRHRHSGGHRHGDAHGNGQNRRPAGRRSRNPNAPAAKAGPAGEIPGLFGLGCLRGDLRSGAV